MAMGLPSTRKTKNNTFFRARIYSIKIEDRCGRKGGKDKGRVKSTRKHTSCQPMLVITDSSKVAPKDKWFPRVFFTTVFKVYSKVH